MLFELQAHSEALARLHLMLQNGSLGVLTGEVGAGKSTLIRHLVSSLDPLRFRPAYLAQAGMRPKDSCGELLRQLGEETPYFLEKARLLFHKTLLQRSQQGDKFLVDFLDEAQDVSSSLLPELRFALNQHMDSTSLFSLILVGQPELRRALKINKLAGLTAEETANYIRHQMKGAGFISPLFSDSAIKLIHSDTRGILRLINNLCTNALFTVRQKGTEIIESELITRIIHDSARQRGLAT
ncbi:MAG: AAA family ATPase [Peptococcaceae bacterium]|nr:AAA family ATPase [Peptococcaceae bacterium]